MRIIAGEQGGRAFPHPGRRVRVTLDGVRETVFNVLADRVSGAAVLDLFAGSGSLGLEALSRGAARCVFVEQDPALADRLVQTLGVLGYSDRAGVVRADVWRPRWPRPILDGGPYDMVFMDPPYRPGAGAACLRIAKRIPLAEGAVVVLETQSKGEGAEEPGWAQVDERRFGQTRVGMFVPAGEICMAKGGCVESPA
ncbi:MAG: 16S rRNA (guanine(966)-N(2))-methyltransferase RsmD [Nitrospirae bacterium]|nr:16S rRNA (guanine(966)-N(2))-methyltransferase RsmD [Nitrospirota bacterium]